MSYRLFHTVTFGLTNQCNANCDFCIVECNSGNKIELEETVIIRAVEELSNIRNIGTIAFTGGEAFLNYEKLKRLVQAVNRVGKCSAVYTNGFWCTDLDITKNRLRELKQMGLTRVLTSVDFEHQKFISVENIRRLLDTCRELDITISVHCVTRRSTLKKTWHILEELADSLIGVSVTTSSVMLIGKAQQSVQKEDIFAKVNISNIHCSSDQMAYVDPKGDVYPCCMGNTPDDLRLGNIYDENVIDCLNRARDNVFFKAIMKNGMQWIMRLAEENRLLNHNDSYGSECEVCVKLLGVLENKNKILELIEKNM